MAMLNPKKPSVAQVLKLVDKLTLQERIELRNTLDNKTWGDEWQALCKKVDEQNKGKPPISEEEIMAEVLAVREEMKAKRANKSSL